MELVRAKLKKKPDHETPFFLELENLNEKIKLFNNIQASRAVIKLLKPDRCREVQISFEKRKPNFPGYSRQQSNDSTGVNQSAMTLKQKTIKNKFSPISHKLKSADSSQDKFQQ